MKDIEIIQTIKRDKIPPRRMPLKPETEKMMKAIATLSHDESLHLKVETTARIQSLRKTVEREFKQNPVGLKVRKSVKGEYWDVYIYYKKEVS